MGMDYKGRGGKDRGRYEVHGGGWVGVVGCSMKWNEG